MEKVLPAVAPAPGPRRERCPAELLARLGPRSVVLVGLMGAGKTTIGRRLADRLGLPFRDADAEIELAAGMPVPEIFARYGESAFRDGEKRVISRLLAGSSRIVLATGGGAFMNPDTRIRIREGAVSVWLRADHGTLMRRVRRRHNRPLLKTADPDETMRKLMADRHPVYAEADLSVDSSEVSHERVTQNVIAALERHLGLEAPS